MDEKQKLNYVKALVYIALADGTIQDEEKIYLRQIGKIYGLSEEALLKMEESFTNKDENIQEVLSGITDRKIKLSLLYDLMALCYADDNYAIVERQGMRNICEIMGIELEKLARLEKVMEEQVAIQKKINIILER